MGYGCGGYEECCVGDGGGGNAYEDEDERVGVDGYVWHRVAFGVESDDVEMVLYEAEYCGDGVAEDECLEDDGVGFEDEDVAD